MAPVILEGDDKNTQGKMAAVGKLFFQGQKTRITRRTVLDRVTISCEHIFFRPLAVLYHFRFNWIHLKLKTKNNNIVTDGRRTCC